MEKEQKFNTLIQLGFLVLKIEWPEKKFGNTEIYQEYLIC